MADDISAWIPVITALAGIGGALGSQYISHRFTLNREKKASEDKMLREQYFIAPGWSFFLSDLLRDAFIQLTSPDLTNPNTGISA